MTISDGTPPYNGTFQIAGNTVNTMTNFGGGSYAFGFTLPVGSYDYSAADFGTFTDAEGCQTEAGTGNDANLTVVAPPTATAPAIAPRCDDGAGNAIDLTQFNAEVGVRERRFPSPWKLPVAPRRIPAPSRRVTRC